MAGVVVGLVLTLTACSSSPEPDAAPDPTTTPVAAPVATPLAAAPPAPPPTAVASPSPPPDPTPVPDVESEILTAYAGFIQAVIDSGNPPDPDHPDLLRYSTGQVLENFQRGRTEQRAMGWRVEGELLSSPLSVSYDGERAVVEDCILDMLAVIAGNGDVVSEVSSEHRFFEVVLVRGDSGWTASELLLGGGCDE